MRGCSFKFFPIGERLITRQVERPVTGRKEREAEMNSLFVGLVEFFVGFKKMYFETSRKALASLLGLAVSVLFVGVLENVVTIRPVLLVLLQCVIMLIALEGAFRVICSKGFFKD